MNCMGLVFWGHWTFSGPLASDHIREKCTTLDPGTDATLKEYKSNPAIFPAEGMDNWSFKKINLTTATCFSFPKARGWNIFLMFVHWQHGIVGRNRDYNDCVYINESKFRNMIQNSKGEKNPTTENHSHLWDNFSLNFPCRLFFLPSVGEK